MSVSACFGRSMDDATLKLTELDEELPGSVVVLDTLTRFVEGDQNSSEDMAQFAQLVFEVQATRFNGHSPASFDQRRGEWRDDVGLRATREHGINAFTTCVWATQLQNADDPHRPEGRSRGFRTAV